MSHEELFYLLALQKIDGVGDVLAKKLCTRFGSAQNVFSAKLPDIAAVGRLGKMVVSGFKNKDVFLKAEQELKYIEAHAVEVLPFNGHSYPHALKHCPDGPLLLFTSGNIALENKPIISVVGTRHVTAQGVDFTRKFIADLAVLDPIIVSGFAYGVDIVAHQAAAEHGLQTCAVLGSGLSRIYPAAHKKYVREISRNGGLITEFWSNIAPERENFVKRNRIVAGMAQATVVIESAERGGSLITAQFAADYNREIFAVPGRPSDIFSAGCNNLIKAQKAHLLTSAADLVYMMNWKLDNAPKPVVQKQLFVTLEPHEQTVFEYLNSNGKQLLDSIALHCKQPVYKLSATLLNMELKGLIRPLPGKLFEAI